MSMKCINTKSPEYLVFQDMTKLPVYHINALIRDYYEKYGDIPTVDKCLTLNEDTRKKLMETYNIKKVGNKYLTRTPIDLIVVNNTHRDLEVTVENTELGINIVNIKQRALLNRELPLDNNVIIFSTDNAQTEEIIPEYQNGDLMYYYHEGKYYVTNQRISNLDALKNYPSSNKISDITDVKLPPNGINSVVIYSILNNKDKLEFGQEIRVLTKLNLPLTITLYSNFNYPAFIINPNSENKIVNGIILLKSIDNLEELLLRMQGYKQEIIDLILANLGTKMEFYTINNGNGNYTVRKQTETYTITNTKPKSELPKNKKTIEPLLDRLENLYGIKFNRVTNEDIENSELSLYVYNATLTNAFILNGEIYINIDNADADAPIHELSHLLLGCLRLTNPKLYQIIVNSVEKYPEYKYELSKYSNRSRLDANEEIFVDLFARHYGYDLDLGIDEDTMTETEYEIARSIDSAIFPNKSTTTADFKHLLQMSFSEIMSAFGTAINRDTLAKAYTGDLAAKSRYIANVKEKLLKNQELKEYCNG